MNQSKHHEVLWDLIKHTRFCMLSHRHADGSLHSHPLTMQNRSLPESNPAVYFFVSTKSEVGQRLRSDGNVNLSFANVKDDTWVSITGTAWVLEDEQKKEELLKMGKAAATGTRPHMGEHKELHFDR